MDERPTSVIAAFFANLLIAVAKFTAFFFTGSSSLLSEGFHSVADTGNQALLFLGHRRARRQATDEHPFGYAPETYFWAFVVAIILFSLGALLSFFEGYDKLMNPEPIASPIWAFAVLGVAMVAESVSLILAARQAHKPADVSWFRHIRSSKEGENPVVLLEDSAAEVGLLAALIGVTLAVITGDSRWDALGSLVIGLILAFVSGLLAVEMRSLLIGEAASAEVRDRIESVLSGAPHVHRLAELKTMHRGPDELLVDARVEFDHGLTFEQVAESVETMKRLLSDQVPIAKHVYLEPVLPE